MIKYFSACLLVYGSLCFSSYAQSLDLLDSLHRQIQQLAERPDLYKAYEPAYQLLLLQDSLLREQQRQMEEYRSTLYAENRLMQVGLLLLVAIVLLLLIILTQYRRARQQLETSKRELEAKRKELERTQNALVQQSFRLEAINEARKQVIKMFSKDLYMPFNRILALIDLLRLDVGYEQLNEHQQEYLQNIAQVAIDGIHKVQNLMDLKRIEEYKTDVQVERFDLVEIVEEIVRSYRPYAYVKDQVLQIERNREEIEMRTDALLVRRIVSQLLSNAIKFSPKEKEIFLRMLDEGDEVLIEIEDEGPGICREDQEKLFKIPNSDHTGFKNKPTGAESATGMGLVLCKNMVDILNGYIECESQEGKGSIFRVRLPKNLYDYRQDRHQVVKV